MILGGDFYEEDEPIEDVIAAWNRGTRVVSESTVTVEPLNSTDEN